MESVTESVLVILLAIMVLAIVFLLFFSISWRKSLGEPPAEEEEPPESLSQKLRREAKEIREGTERLRAARSPLSAPAAVDALIWRLDQLNAEADNLDAKLDREEEVAKALLAEKIKQAENEIKQLELQNAPKNKIDKVQKQLDKLILQQGQI